MILHYCSRCCSVFAQEGRFLVGPGPYGRQFFCTEHLAFALQEGFVDDPERNASFEACIAEGLIRPETRPDVDWNRLLNDGA